MRSWLCQSFVSRVRPNNYANHLTKRLSNAATNVNDKPLRRRDRPSLILGRHVREALLNNSPIVALESTVITHGLPEPSNLELALRLEDEIAKGYWWRDTAANEPDRGQEGQQRLGGIRSVDVISNERRQPISSGLELAATSDYSGLVTPATIGIVKGQIVVGLSRDELEYLACRERSRPIKASRRDIPIALARGLSAGTTVSATMAIASSGRLMALALNSESSLSSAPLGGSFSRQRSVRNENRSALGGGASPIKVFATGGMGGVHLGGEQSMDISADLYEFARSPIGLVSSGFKSFLDTRRSLEFLETLGCTVTSLIGFESTYEAQRAGGDNPIGSSPHGGDSAGNEESASRAADLREHRGHLFPGFFSAVSKERVQSPWRCASVKEAAEILFECLEAPVWRHHSYEFGPESKARAMLLACPIPRKFGLNLDEDLVYKRAMELVGAIDRRHDLAGNEKTPLILEKLNQSTGGKTLRANMELLRNNARIGAHLAHEYALLSANNSRTGAVLPPQQQAAGPAQG